MGNKFVLVSISVLITAVAAATVFWIFRENVAPSSAHHENESTRAAPSASEDSLKAKGFVSLTEEQVRQFGIETGRAGPGKLRIEVTLPGEVALNADRVAHVVPRVSGVVREVRKNLGDQVYRGEIMAVLESRELADSRAALLAARERLILAQSNFSREEHLWQKKISPEQDYIQARNSLAEAGIVLRAAEQGLRALGFSDDYIAQLSTRQDNAAILYEMAAPFDATVTEKHISLGEVLKEDSSAFVIADLSSVWVNLDVHQKDLPYIRIGQRAVISVGSSIPDAEGAVSFLEPIATETNRTIHARVVMPNADARFRPGLFITGRIIIDDLRIPVLVSNDTLVMVEGKSCLFVKDGQRFRLQTVTTGRANGSYTEIVQGLTQGQTYVTKGAFTLKSELGKPEAER
jgi:membrane fusion protein, heavy metal efflux system